MMTMQQLLTPQGDPVYIDLDCGAEVTAWGPAEVAEYGPLAETGCDRCDSPKARWVPVWVQR